MCKVAVVFADGCEEVEGLSTVDVLRRLGVQTDMFGLNKKDINGDHQIKLTCDKVVDDSLLDYDLVAFPGGKTGAENLRDSSKLAELMNKRHNEGKWDAAMCAAPIALARYGVDRKSVVQGERVGEGGRSMIEKKKGKKQHSDQEQDQ